MAERGGEGGITGRMARIYDVFVDWEGRLAREMPGLDARLRAADARAVLDVGCGTGRHVRALLELGYDAHGADASEDMLDEARELLGGGERLHAFRLGEDEPPESLVRRAPFDACLLLGNVWPQIVGEEEAERASDALRRLLRPGGLLVLGLKAVAVRRERGEPYMPLLRRARPDVQEGRPLWFVRFVDFEVPPRADGVRAADLHMVVVAGDATPGAPEPEALLHRAGRIRVWSADELERWLLERGWSDVRVSGSMGDPLAPPSGEDVVASARAPG